MHCGFGYNVGVEAVAEVDRINVVTKETVQSVYCSLKQPNRSVPKVG